MLLYLMRRPQSLPPVQCSATAPAGVSMGQAPPGAIAAVLLGAAPADYTATTAQTHKYAANKINKQHRNLYQ